MSTVTTVLIVFVGLFPVVTASVWIAGGLLFRLLDENNDGEMPAGGWPGVTILIPAYNEEAVIANCVRAARAVDYPDVEILVLDDGCTDATADRAEEAREDDPRVEVVLDTVNRGKAERLNVGFRRARHELVVVTDADTHLHPRALRMLVSRLSRSERVAAVAGAPHVTNRDNLWCALQVLEVAAIIGLIRRTGALAGSVSTVAGVLGLFRRQVVLDVGGYREEMATEDIDLSWRLLLAGWDTMYEPEALVGMQVPSSLSALWKQRRRWAAGQGEVIRMHAREVAHWRSRRLWPLLMESIGSLVWVTALVFATVMGVIALITGDEGSAFHLGLEWGLAIAVVSLLQLAFALQIDFHNDHRALIPFMFGPLYPLAYWILSAAAAVRSETVALWRGPAKQRVVWNIPRDSVDAEAS